MGFTINKISMDLMLIVKLAMIKHRMRGYINLITRSISSRIKVMLQTLL